MKNKSTQTITALIVSLTFAHASSNFQVAEVKCGLENETTLGIQEITLTSTRAFDDSKPTVSDGLTIVYKNGQEEMLRPSAKTDNFGNPTYSGKVPFIKGQVFFPDSKVGDIYVKFQCFYAPGIPWDRCQSQGSGEHGALSQVQLNLGGKVVSFGGNNLCTRSVVDHEG